MRWGARVTGGATGGAGVVLYALPGSGAGLAGNGGDVNSGCWDILEIRPPSLIPLLANILHSPGNPGPAQGRRIATVTQQGRKPASGSPITPPQNRDLPVDLSSPEKAV